jgi:hypothetical protein
MKLLLVDLYCTTNHVGAKNGPPLKARKKLPWKDLPKVFSHEFIANLFSSIV